MTDPLLASPLPEQTATHRSRVLLQPIVDTARGVFAAAASSIFIYDGRSDSLVFGAVAGAGEERLVGRSFPADTGVAGFVLRTRQSMLLDDLANNPLFSRDAAASTSYVPTSMMAAPLLFEEDCVGVLQVLDWTNSARGPLDDLSLLLLISAQAAAAVRLLAASDWAADEYADPRGRALCAQIVGQMSRVSAARVEAALQMLRAVASMLATDE